MKNRLKIGPGGWLAVAAVVVAADYAGERTMSDLFHDASRHPVGGPLVVAGWAVLTAHLFGVLPAQRDPLKYLGRHIRKDT